MKHSGIAGVMGLLALVACSDGQAALEPNSAVSTTTADAGSHTTEPRLSARVSDEGRVVVEIVPLNLDQPEESLHFQVAMNTHWVELDYDLTRLATLRTDQGETVEPLRWDGARGGHHVAGILYFPLIDLEGVGWVEMVIQGVADVPERSFRWELGSPGR